jgi:hypothetical protein
LSIASCYPKDGAALDYSAFDLAAAASASASAFIFLANASY